MLWMVALALADEPLVFEPVPVKAAPPKPDVVIVLDRLPTGERVNEQLENKLDAELKEKAEAATAPR